MCCCSLIKSLPEKLLSRSGCSYQKRKLNVSCRKCIILSGTQHRPRRSFYRPDIGGIIREMSTPASLSWRRYGSNDVLNGVRAGPASALR